MKRIVIVFGIVSFAIIMVSYKANHQPITAKNSPSPDSQRTSLTGDAYSDVNKWILNFQDDPGGYDSKTTFWLSKDYIDIIDTLLTHENADGVRIYLARRPNEETTTLVLVSTKEDGPDSDHPGKTVHLDYFNHSTSFLASLNGTIYYKDENGDDGGGATLYINPNCPPESCNVQAINYIKCADAARWVQNTVGDDIYTHCEWFSLHLIENINKELHAAIAAHINADGIRIYLAETDTNPSTHRFIIATTESYGTKYHKDYYQCYYHTDKIVNDNGELCPVNCSGSTLPNTQ